MLTKLLSRLFPVAFLVIAVIGIDSFVSQFLKGPIFPLTENNRVYSFGSPGIGLTTRKKITPEPPAGDVIVSYTATDSSGAITQSGGDTISVNENPDSALAMLKALIPPGPPGTNKIKNMVQLEEYTTETIRVLPSGILQQAGFGLYDLIRFGCPALLFLGLATLFRNFIEKKYFTLPNVMLLRNLGWLLLIPQILAAIVFWIFLVKIKPSHMQAGDQETVSPMAFYDVYANLDWTLICIGLGLIVLSYVFKEGFELEEDLVLTT